jgi:hypothetical protein
MALANVGKGLGASARPGCARMDRLAIGPQVANLPHNFKQGNEDTG